MIHRLIYIINIDDKEKCINIIIYKLKQKYKYYHV